MHYIKKTHILAIVFLLSLIGWLFFTQEGSQEEQTSHVAQSTLFKVGVQYMHQMPEPLFLSLFGYTSPRYSVAITSGVSGILKNTPIDDGGLVEKDTILAEIDGDKYKKKLESVQAVYDLVSLEAKNAKILRKEGVSSKVSNLKAISELKKAAFDLHHAKNEVEYSNITAPFKGVVSEYALDVGAYVSVGDLVVKSIDALDPLLVVAYVSQFDRYKIQVGKVAEVIFPDGETVQGRVFSLSSTADPGTRTYKVQVEIDNSDYKHKAGMSVTLRLVYDYLPIYKIPAQALSLSDEGDFGVKVVEEGNRVVYKPIDILYSDDNFFYVKGLSENECLILDGHAFVVPGEEVDPIEISQHNAADLNQ